MTALSPQTGRTLRWIFAAQIAFAAVLIGADLTRVLPTLLSPSDAPQLTQPIGPGDQIRRFAPAELAPRTAAPGTRPLPMTTDMPSRLDFAAADWNGAPVITLTGQIAPGDAARFSDFLSTLAPPPTSAFLNSPGGSVIDALAIGRAMRDAGLNSELTATDICLSACPYLLAAGLTRTVAPEALVGVHQHYFGENTALPAFLAVEDIQRGQGEVMRYLAEMGIDPLMMQHALTTPPDEIYLLTPTQQKDYRLTTPVN